MLGPAASTQCEQSRSLRIRMLCTIGLRNMAVLSHWCLLSYAWNVLDWQVQQLQACVWLDWRRYSCCLNNEFERADATHHSHSLAWAHHLP